MLLHNHSNPFSILIYKSVYSVPVCVEQMAQWWIFLVVRLQPQPVNQNNITYKLIWLRQSYKDSFVLVAADKD